MASVLVTGGAGYLGSVLCEELAKAGHWVTVCDAGWGGTSHIEGKAQEIFVGDICDLDREVIISHTAVIHLAAVSREGDTQHRHLMQRHPYETAQLVRRMDLGRQRLLYASTASVYGRSCQARSESDEAAPVCEYGRMKHEAERIVVQAGGTALRMGTLCGASPKMRWDLAVNAMVKSLVETNTIRVWGPTAWRTFLWVRDAARAYSQLLAMDRTRIAGMAINLATFDTNMQALAKSLALWWVVMRKKPEPEIVTDATKTELRSYTVSSELASRLGIPIEPLDLVKVAEELVERCS